MTLPEALPLVFTANARITRRVWTNSKVYVELHQSLLCLKGHPDDGLWHPWTIHESDWFGDDWEVVDA